MEDLLYTYKQLDLPLLQSELLACYQQLTEPRFYSCLLNKDPYDITGSQPIACGVEKDGRPIGLAIACLYPETRYAEVHSLFIESGFRRQGLGKKLFETLDMVLLEKRCRQATFLYPNDAPWTQDCETLLEHQGWNVRHPFLVRFLFNAETFTTPWLHRPYPLPKDCRLFFWEALLKKDKEKILFQLKSRIIPPVMDPLADPELLDKGSSLGIRDEQGVIGWVINHRKKADMITFSSLFVFPHAYTHGHAIKLLTESIHLIQKQQPPRFAELEVNLNLIDSRWVKFLKRRLFPYAEKIERTYQAWKRYESV